jgi:hypothetical protein
VFYYTVSQVRYRGLMTDGLGKVLAYPWLGTSMTSVGVGAVCRSLFFGRRNSAAGSDATLCSLILPYLCGLLRKANGSCPLVDLLLA